MHQPTHTYGGYEAAACATVVSCYLAVHVGSTTLQYDHRRITAQNCHLRLPQHSHVVLPPPHARVKGLIRTCRTITSSTVQSRQSFRILGPTTVSVTGAPTVSITGATTVHLRHHHMQCHRTQTTLHKGSGHMAPKAPRSPNLSYFALHARVTTGPSRSTRWLRRRAGSWLSVARSSSSWTSQRPRSKRGPWALQRWPSS